MQTRITKRALGDMHHVRDFIARDDKRAAVRVLTAMKTAIASLSELPLLGRVGRVTGTRELILGSSPYIIVYRVDKTALEILAVIHTARVWPDEF